MIHLPLLLAARLATRSLAAPRGTPATRYFSSTARASSPFKDLVPAIRNLLKSEEVRISRRQQEEDAILLQAHVERVRRTLRVDPSPEKSRKLAETPAFTGIATEGVPTPETRTPRSTWDHIPKPWTLEEELRPPHLPLPAAPSQPPSSSTPPGRSGATTPGSASPAGLLSDQAIIYEIKGYRLKAQHLIACLRSSRDDTQRRLLAMALGTLEEDRAAGVLLPFYNSLAGGETFSLPVDASARFYASGGSLVSQGTARAWRTYWRAEVARLIQLYEAMVRTRSMNDGILHPSMLEREVEE